MKYRDIRLGDHVRIKKKSMCEQWGDCRVIDKGIKGILTVEELDHRHRHYVGAARVALIDPACNVI